MIFTATKDTPELRQSFRTLRDAWLVITDAYMLEDRGLTEDEKSRLLQFRQALRDSTAMQAKPTEWAIPVVPEFIRNRP